jgi:hypothetical protein
MRSTWRACLVITVALSAAARADVKGDLNGDGRVDSGDGAIETRIVGGWIALNSLPTPSHADVAPIVGGVGGDGAVDVADAALMLRALGEFDVDGDTLLTSAENAIGASPFLRDTDGDGIDDPLDPTPAGGGGGILPGPRIFDGPSAVSVSWVAPAGPVGHYIVHRYGTDGEYTYFIVDASATTFSDPTAVPGEVYFYFVQAVDLLGNEGEFVNCDLTDPSNSSPWLTGALGPIPNPHFVASASPGAATLTWEQSQAPGVIGYRIYRSPTLVPLGTTTGLAVEQTINSPTTTIAMVGGLASGKHYFRLTAFTATTEGLLESARQVVVDVP